MGETYRAFANRRIRPLCHLSSVGLTPSPILDKVCPRPRLGPFNLTGTLGHDLRAPPPSRDHS